MIQILWEVQGHQNVYVTNWWKIQLGKKIALDEVNAVQYILLISEGFAIFFLVFYILQELFVRIFLPFALVKDMFFFSLIGTL